MLIREGTMAYHQERLVRAPLERLWRAWTTGNGTKGWLAPRTHVIFEEGGLYEFFWADDPAVDSTVGCRLLEIEPGRRLRFQWQGRTEFMHLFRPPNGPTVIEVRFQPVEGGTRVVLEQPESRDHPDWARYEAWMIPAWERALAALARYCEQAEARSA